jgi:hypothetical protein
MWELPVVISVMRQGWGSAEGDVVWQSASWHFVPKNVCCAVLCCAVLCAGVTEGQ